MMMDQSNDNPIVVMMLSSMAGLASYAAKPDVMQALLVAALCGFVGGLCKAAGVWAWNRARECQEKKRDK